MLRDEPLDSHPVLAVADQHEPGAGVRAVKGRECLDEHRQPLEREKRTDESDHEIAVPETSLSATSPAVLAAARDLLEEMRALRAAAVRPFPNGVR